MIDDASTIDNTGVLFVDDGDAVNDSHCHDLSCDSVAHQQSHMVVQILIA